MVALEAVMRSKNHTGSEEKEVCQATYYGKVHRPSASVRPVSGICLLQVHTTIATMNVNRFIFPVGRRP